MGAPFRKTDPQSRKFLLAELKRIGRQERTPNEQMIASFVQCEKAQKASQVVASVLGRHRYNETSDPNAERLASLAAMTVARQSPGLVLPFLTSIPTSFTYTKGDDNILTLARSLVELGLGTAELWERHNANTSAFIRDSIGAWLSEIGADEMNGETDVDLAIFDALENEAKPTDGRLYILLDTPDGCGFIAVGDELELLEKEHVGLGRAFYLVLLGTMNQWMDVYDAERTRYFLDNWKESIEQDIEGEGEYVPEELFAEYLKAHDIDFPDLDAAIPECAKNVGRKEYRSARALLQKHRKGRYAKWIEPLLTMDAVKQRKSTQDPRDFEGNWDDGPLPTWVLAFDHHDPISQAFDEEATGMNECSHAPTWIAAFNPADKKDVRRVLERVRGFVMVNRQIVKLSKLFDKRRKSLGHIHQPQIHGQLRAA